VPSKRRKRTPPERGGPRRSSAQPATPEEKRSGRETSNTSDTDSKNDSRHERDYSYGRAVDRGLEAARRVVDGVVGAVDATTRGAVERGVETAYAVVDEYMRRGRTAASQRRNGNSGNSGNPVNYGNFGGGSVGHQHGGYSTGGGGAGNGGGPFNSGGGPWGGGNMSSNPMFAPWIQMMRMWTDSMMAFMPTGAPNPFAMWTGAAQPRPAIAVRTASVNPAEVTVTLDAGAEWLLLRVDALENPDEPGASSIAAPTITCEPGRVSVHVSVPASQTAGHYHGTIRDSGGVRRGELCVDVEAPRSAGVPV